jgi:type IV secretion system protein VirB8
MPNLLNKALVTDKKKENSPQEKAKKKISEVLERNKKNVGARKKISTAKNVDIYLNSIKDFESDRVALAKNSEKIAWRVSAGFATIGILAVISVMLLTPLKSVELRVLRVDNTDGSVSVLSKMMDAKKITYGEVLDVHWSKNFITARNGYNWETIQHNFNTVSIMSNRVVNATYNSYIKAKNSPLKLFTDKKRIKISIQDVTFLPTKEKTSKLAQIRFSRDVINAKGESLVSIEKTFWNATITFDYAKVIKTGDERRLNPLGFRVTSYTEDRVSKK